MRWRRTFAAMVVAGTMLAGVAGTSAPATAAGGGPVVLMGIDAEDCGPGGHGPISVYESVVSSMLGGVSNGGSGILVLGANGSCVTSFWDAIGTDLGITVSYGSTSDSLAAKALVAVASDEFNTSGGLTSAQNDALAARSADFANHVNGGGGLLGFSNCNLSSPYGYIAGLGAVTCEGTFESDITPTAEGAAIGVSDALDVCCWHDILTAFPAFLVPLADYASGSGVAAIGGAEVTVGISLTPETATNPAGTSHTVTAKVTDASGGAVSGTTVSFSVLSGPNAGLSGSDVTDSNGEATFTYTSNGATGTDQIQASFQNAAGETIVSNVAEKTWTEPTTRHCTPKQRRKHIHGC